MLATPQTGTMMRSRIGLWMKRVQSVRLKPRYVTKPTRKKYMHTTMSATLLFAALSLGAAPAAAQVAGSSRDKVGASSVAGMQQRKHDASLRADYVREGRSDDIRKLDEASVRQLKAQRDQQYLKLNEDLTHGTAAGPPVDVRAPDCVPAVGVR